MLGDWLKKSHLTIKTCDKTLLNDIGRFKKVKNDKKLYDVSSVSPSSERSDEGLTLETSAS